MSHGAPTMRATDLTPSRFWPTPPEPEDEDWLRSVASLQPERFVLRSLDDHAVTTDDEPILHRDIDGWRAGRYIGEIRHQGRTLQISPRIGVATVGEWAAAAHNVAVLPDAAGLGGSVQSILVQLVAAMWRASILDAGRHALPRRRVTHVHNGLEIRGRLDAQRTARRRAGGDPLLVSVRRERESDAVAAAAVVCADRVLSRFLADDRWRGRRLDAIVTEMRSVVGPRPRLPTLRELDAARYAPIAARWRAAAALSWKVARLDMLSASPDDEQTYGALVDVAELWELFLVRCAADAIAAPVTHGTRGAGDRHLLVSVDDTTRGLGRLFPDIVVGHPDATPEAIIDAKYKRLRFGRPDREDLYQVAAYGAAYKPKRALLAYPDVSHEAFEDGGAAVENEQWTGVGDVLFQFRRLPVERSACTAWFTAWCSGSE